VAGYTRCFPEHHEKTVTGSHFDPLDPGSSGPRWKEIALTNPWVVNLNSNAGVDKPPYEDECMRASPGVPASATFTKSVRDVPEWVVNDTELQQKQVKQEPKPFELDSIILCNHLKKLRAKPNP
jgi:hypothetical protein